MSLNKALKATILVLLLTINVSAGTIYAANGEDGTEECGQGKVLVEYEGPPGKFTEICVDEEDAGNPCTTANPYYNPEGSGDGQCATGCIYDSGKFQLIRRYDLNKNCRIDEGSESCLQEFDELNRQKVETCIEDPQAEACLEQYVCDFGASEPRTVRRDAATPFESEFFDVTEDLRVEEQGTAFTADAEGGPIVNVVLTVLNFLVGIVSTIALIVFAIGVFFLVTAGGEENAIEKGKNAIKYSLLGIIVVLLSYSIVVFVRAIFS